jgi:hypothetical protein
MSTECVQTFTQQVDPNNYIKNAQAQITQDADAI